ncbi:MAG: twin-arginine translocase TatA/TatE family subunit [Deltaproteobacteria bacterium]|nr:twin-arginine translocase TatA/TatE family subunit [Deltaproteobacteria bacterium]MBW1922591.1 twin-arginine translocase TatA/TatE family subunit [Deltaproteobacteria bacterium]MBW1951108.1 twin-arginine translocase TatA/TatE family subunit [Deltaproteobacteria bacterium]MBW2007786.1 twin-arginine translocase TatA/TatE family subunit [Deltaproteobacteria bacterium]MBW2347196.1 twin-arginine translocase TatA/TatE family subunit [Deltaproteobacteria bacterium]
MFGLGPTELTVIAVIVLLIFGARRLPEIGKGLGGAVREFKKVKKELKPETASETHEAGVENGENKAAPSLEQRAAAKVLEQVPGVKKAMDVKKKAEKVRDILK